jgi:hypothetical protein
VMGTSNNDPVLCGLVISTVDRKKHTLGCGGTGACECDQCDLLMSHLGFHWLRCTCRGLSNLCMFALCER